MSIILFFFFNFFYDDKILIGLFRSGCYLFTSKDGWTGKHDATMQLCHIFLLSYRVFCENFVTRTARH